jgi:hypothetical protein
MKTLRPAGCGALVIAAIGASLCVLATAPAALAGNGLGSVECRYARASSCVQPRSNAAGGLRPYQQWQDGSPAVGSTTLPQHYGNIYSNGHNALYGFGR